MLSLRSGRHLAPSAPHRGRKGFTLAELIVGMVLLSIVCTAILSMIISQSRYVGQINTDVQMLDQVRAANELMGSEIADLPRGAILFARNDSVVYQLPITWGVICGPTNRQAVQAPPVKGAPKGVVVAPSTNIALQFEPAASDLGNPTPEGLGISSNGVNFNYYPVANWSSLAMTSDTSAASSCLDAPAAAPAKKGPIKANKSLPPPPTTTVIESLDDYYMTTHLGATIGTDPTERSLIFAYVKVSYYLKPVTGNGTVLYRATATGTQKLAWPFSTSAGFTYRLDDNSTATSIAAADLPRIRAVRVDLPVTRSARNNRKADTLLVQPWIPLYNAR